MQSYRSNGCISWIQSSLTKWWHDHHGYSWSIIMCRIIANLYEHILSPQQSALCMSLQGLLTWVIGLQTISVKINLGSSYCFTHIKAYLWAYSIYNCGLFNQWPRCISIRWPLNYLLAIISTIPKFCRLFHAIWD